MEGEDDPKEIKRKIEQATRIVSGVSDATTYVTLVAWIAELKDTLRRRQEARKLNYKIRARARELWEQAGRPPGRDDEFWLLAETEISAQS
jgi:hypothetical protein